MSAEPPDLPGPTDPSVDRLIRVLTADGSADELARRQAALTMFRDSRRRPRRRFSFPMSTAAAAVVVVAGLASAYAAGNSAAVFTLVMPTLDPCEAGLTIMGRPMRSSARSRSAGPDNTTYSGAT